MIPTRTEREKEKKKDSNGLYDSPSYTHSVSVSSLGSSIEIVNRI